MPVYAFNSGILKALDITHSGVGGEIQLTDGIQEMVDWGLVILAVELKQNDICLDIGSPDLYWESQKLSYKYSTADARGEH